MMAKGALVSASGSWAASNDWVKSAQQLRRPGNSSCWNGVRAYVYSLPWPFDDQKRPAYRSLRHKWQVDLYRLQNKTFGFAPAWDQMPGGASGPYAYLEGSHTLGDVALMRLARSGCTTRDPARADIFVIPLLTHTKHYQHAEDQCAAMNLHTNGYRDLLPHLPHLRPANAHRHIIFKPNTAQCFGWWELPLPELAHVRKFHSSSIPSAYGTIDVPYPSAVLTAAHPASAPPLPYKNPHAPRKTLAALVTVKRMLGPQSDPRASPLRYVLYDTCDASERCELHVPTCEASAQQASSDRGAMAWPADGS